MNYLKEHKIFLNILILFSFILLSILSAILLLKNNILYTGVDTQFHMRRIMEIKSSIDKNAIFPNFSFNYFHGSGVMNLYPYLNLLPAIILSYIIKSPVGYIYSLFIINTLFTFVISFYSNKKYIGTYSTAYVFSIVYSLSNVLLMYNIISEDLGIVYSYMFLPLAIFGFLQIIQKRNSWLELSIGMSLILYSHIINLLFIVIFLIILLMINIKKLDINTIVDLFKAFILFLFLSSIIWLPFLYFYFHNLGNINMPTVYQLDKIPIKKFIAGIYGSKSNSSIGFFPLVVLFIAPFFYKKFNRYDKQIYILSLLIILLVLFLPWKLITSYTMLKFLNQLQFTFRFLFIPQMLLTYIFSVIVSKYSSYSIINKYISYLFIVSFAIFMQMAMGQYSIINNLSNSPSNGFFFQINPKGNGTLSPIINYKINNYDQFYYFINNTYHPEDDDYIPKAAISMSPYVNQNLGFYNNHYKINVDHSNYNTFNFLGNDSIDKLSLPIYAYNNERLHVYLNDKPIKNYADRNGLLTIDNIQGNIKLDNKIYIKPVSNPFRIIGAVLSVFGWLFSLSILIKRHIDKKKS